MAPPASHSAAPLSTSDNGAASSTALTVADNAPPPLRLAASLDDADPRSLVHIDHRGQVRSPARYHAMNALATACSGVVAGLGSLFYAGLFGPVWGLAAGVVFGGAIAIGISRRRRLRRVAELIADNRLAEAERLCRDALSGRFVPRAIAAAAHHNLGIIASRRGDFAIALEEVRASAKLRQKGLRLARRNVYDDILGYAEITLLVNLGRTGEARARLDARRATPDGVAALPEGDLLLLLHAAADLAVQFAEGYLTLDEDQLWDQSRRALRLHSAPHLLALCAWAHSTLGGDSNLEMSDHLVAEALDRVRATPESPITFPSLWEWVDLRASTDID